MSVDVVKTLDRGLELLEEVFSRGSGISLAELTRLQGRDKSSIYRMLLTLQRRGYVVRDPGGKRYCPGHRIYELAGSYGPRRDIRRMSRAYLERLTELIGETSHLAVLIEREARLVDHVLSPQRVGVTARSGGHEPIHATALGKILVAYLPQGSLRKLLDGYNFEKYTQWTFGSLDAFQEELKLVKERGWAVDDEEYSEGIRCVAAPVFDFTGRVTGAIGISGPSQRIEKENIPKLGEMVKEITLELSRELGFLPIGE